MKRALLLLSVVALASVAAASASGPVSIWGRLRVAGGRGPIAGGVVRFESRTLRYSAEVAVDEKGRFARLGLPAGTYTATVVRDGFAPVEVVDIVARPGRRLRLDVDLTPIDEAPFARERRVFRAAALDTESGTVEYRFPR
jgi:hypothetical protein